MKVLLSINKKYFIEEQAINNEDAEGEYESEWSGDEIIGYIEETDNIVLSSGKIIKNNNQISKKDLKFLVKNSQIKKIGQVLMKILSLKILFWNIL